MDTEKMKFFKGSISHKLAPVFLVLFGYIGGFSDATTPSGQCPAGWLSIHRGCYQFVENAIGWNEAQQICNGSLLNIESAAEKEEIEKYLKTKAKISQSWWIGLIREAASGTDWRWSQSRDPITSVTLWLDENRPKRNKKVCGLLFVSDRGIRLSNADCSNEHTYICECHPANTTHVTPVNTSPVVVSRGATIREDIETTSVASGHTVDLVGTIMGFSNSSRQNTGGLFSSMKAMTISRDQHTSPQVESTLDRQSNSEGGLEARTHLGSTPAHVRTSDSVQTRVHTDVEESIQTTLTQTRMTAVPWPSSPRSSDSSPISSVSSHMSLPVASVSPVSSPSTPVQRSSIAVQSSPSETTAQEPEQRGQTISPQVSSSYPAEASGTRPSPPEPTMVDWLAAFKEFEGCYIPGSGSSLRDRVMTARALYREGAQACPKLQVGHLKWPHTPMGQTAKLSCGRGDHAESAVFECGRTPVCWRGQPNTHQCSSKKLQSVFRKMNKDPQSTPPTLSETMEVSSALALAMESQSLTVDDVLMTSDVLTSLSRMIEASPALNKSTVTQFIQDLMTTAGTIVSNNNSLTWQDMSVEEQVRAGSLLVVAMETAAIASAQRLEEPTVINMRTNDTEVAVRVLEVDKLVNELVYGSGESDHTFSIPVDTLKGFRQGKLVRAVFITHYSMSSILSGRSKHAKKHSLRNRDLRESSSWIDTTIDPRSQQLPATDQPQAPVVASHILSASVGAAKNHGARLTKPVSFTMKHLQNVDSQFTTLCSFWNVRHGSQSGFWSQDGCRLLSTNQTHTSCQCDHMTNFAILLDIHSMKTSEMHRSVLRVVSVIGCVISCVCLLASWITFQCFTSLQGERNSIHKNLAFTLFLAEVVFVVGIDQAQHEVACSIIAGLLHYLFLAAFTWMFIEGLHIIFMLVQVFDASRSRLPFYYLAGYGAPLLIVGFSSLFYYQGYGTEKYCWLTTENYFIWAFAGPVATVLLVNAVFLTYALTTVCRHSDYVFSAKDKTNGSGIRAWVQGALALEVLLGLTWTLGYFIINEDSLPLAYVFAVLNSLQGLFIFIFHCLLNKKAQKEYRQVMGRMVKRSASSLTTTQSTLTKRTQNTNNSQDHNSPNGSHQKLNTNNSHSLA